MTLFEECISALGDKTEVLSQKETEKVFKSMINIFPMTTWGKIDWDRIDGEYHMVLREDILEQLNKVYKNVDTAVFVLWGEASLPAVRADLNKTIEVIDDVTAVSFDTWIFCPSANYVIEFYHENEIRIGWMKA